MTGGRNREQNRSSAARFTASALCAFALSGALLPGPAPAVAAPQAGDPVTAPQAGDPAAATRPVLRPVVRDPVRDEQWQVAELKARTAWPLSTGRGVTVAVIDSGVDGAHPDLAGQVLPGLDLVRGSGDGWTDPVGHGTTVAGLIAGRGDDGRGVLGLAPEAKILPVRVLDEENRYDDALVVARAVRWAVDNGARVINLSLGGTAESSTLAAALDYAYARDVVVVACSGNLLDTTGQEVWYPAREPGVVAVTGTEGDGDTLWSGAITGPQTVLTAPATGLLGARPGGYWRVQGTSFAAPMVTATAALIRARWPGMSAAEVINRLILTARDLGTPGRDDRYGFGMVDPVAALRAAVPAVTRNPLDDGVSPGVARFGPAPAQARTAVRPGDPPETGGRVPKPHPPWAARLAGTPVGEPRPGP